VTKAGQYFPAWMRAARPFKRIIKPLVRQSGAGRYVISKAREASSPQNFSEGYLRASIESSLKRLNTDYADNALLHSPSPEVITNGDALRSLERIRAAGKAAKIGISFEDIESGLLALDDSRVEAIELPLWPITEATTRFLDRARHQAVYVIGRGLMSAVPATGSDDRWSAALPALVASLPRREISRVLIGTTRLSHLTQVLDLVQSAEKTSCS